ncbi:MAG: DNA-binding protein [Planctomycetota bacterium]|nr:DNA-binding protein [Planctomycetota bacterium]
MATELLSTREAACRLGTSTTTLYDWLGLSDLGLLVIRGQTVTIQYFQGGPQGQGRIRIEAAEVERILELMRVHPQHAKPVRRPMPRQAYAGITVPLGRPGSHL